MATKDELPLKYRISLSFQQLVEGAARLNKASDDLSEAIGPLDAAFSSLNLGVTTWHQYYDESDDSGAFWRYYVGYAKVDGKWGLALSEVSGDEALPPEENYDKEWLFNDAPRDMRVDAIPHIPALLDAIVKQVNDTASDLEAKAAIARDVASTIKSLTTKKAVTK